MNIKTKRVYEQDGPNDGFRILVDRLWPRGLSKKDAKIDLWLRSIGPSDQLRKWFNHEPEKWTAFKKSYFSELDSNKDVVNELVSHVDNGPVCLLYSSKEQQYNNATALAEYIKDITRRSHRA